MPLRIGLTHTQMKMGWAYKRLDELKGEVEKFRKDAYTLIAKDDLDQLRHHVAVAQKTLPTPSECSLENSPIRFVPALTISHGSSPS